MSATTVQITMTAADCSDIAITKAHIAVTNVHFVQNGISDAYITRRNRHLAAEAPARFDTSELTTGMTAGPKRHVTPTLAPHNLMGSGCRGCSTLTICSRGRQQLSQPIHDSCESQPLLCDVLAHVWPPGSLARPSEPGLLTSWWQQRRDVQCLKKTTVH
jgi:hypothetical protein